MSGHEHIPDQENSGDFQGSDDLDSPWNTWDQVRLFQQEEIIAATACGEETPGSDDERTPLLELARRLVRKGELERAQEVYNALRNLSVSREDMVGACHAMLAIGYLHARLGEPSSAVECFAECLRVLDTLDAPALAGATWLAIGTFHLHAGETGHALECFTRSLASYKASGYRYGEVEALLKKAEAHGAAGDFPPALSDMLRALVIFEDLGEEERIGETLSAIGTVYLHAGDLQTAFDYQQLALTRARELGDDALKAQALLRMAEISIMLNDHEGARGMIAEGLRHAGTVNEPILLAHLHRLAAATLEALGEEGAALEHYKLFTTLREQQQQLRQEGRMTEMRMKIDLERATAQQQELGYRMTVLDTQLSKKAEEADSLQAQLAHKSKLLSDVRNELKSLMETAQHRTQALTRTVVDRLGTEDPGIEDWQMFEQRLDEVNREFMRALAERFPTLTPMEMRISLLTKLDLPTKDIAKILFVSIRNVENHRYRLRKKLGLSSKDSLLSFLMKL